jgi:hypothetical protein
MTTLTLTHSTTLPALPRSLWLLLAHLGGAIDAAVSARAARAVPEWQMRKVRSDIRRYRRPARKTRRPA